MRTCVCSLHDPILIPRWMHGAVASFMTRWKVTRTDSLPPVYWFVIYLWTVFQLGCYRIIWYLKDVNCEWEGIWKEPGVCQEATGNVLTEYPRSFWIGLCLAVRIRRVTTMINSHKTTLSVLQRGICYCQLRCWVTDHLFLCTLSVTGSGVVTEDTDRQRYGVASPFPDSIFVLCCSPVEWQFI